MESPFFHATPILPPFFGVRWIRPNRILGPPYPEVTLDNFSFPVGGLSAARRAVFRPRGRILARKSVFCYRTPDFVNGFFVALDDIFDLAPSDRFLNFLFPSYGVSPSGLRLENLHFFTLHPYNPHFLESDGSDPMRTYVPHILR